MLRDALVVLLCSFTLIACGDDDSGSDTGSDTGSEAGTDSGFDAADAAVDTNTEDASADVGEDAGSDASEDSSVDADAGSDADVCASAALGEACPEDGVSCGGPCTDECSFCNVIFCRDGTWQRLEAPPLPCFSCGDSLRCPIGDSFCAQTISDVVGEPDDFRCVDTPADCVGGADCACLAASVIFSMCEEVEGGIVVTIPGG